MRHARNRSRAVYPELKSRSIVLALLDTLLPGTAGEPAVAAPYRVGRCPEASGVYNDRLNPHAMDRHMEAEQLNTIENRLDDLGQRATELRRYL